MARQLNLDRDKLDQCYELASQIIVHAYKYIDRHSTLSVERATLMLLGLDQEYKGRSLASWLVSSLTKDQLRIGSALWWGRALVGVKEEPKSLAERLGRGKLKWENLPEVPFSEVKKETLKLAKENLEKISIGHSVLQKGKFFTAAPFADTKPKRFKNDLAAWQQHENAVAFARFQSKRHFQEVWECEEFRSAFESANLAKTIPILEGLVLPEQAVHLLKRGFPLLGAEGWYAIWNKELDAKRSLIDFAFVLKLCSKWQLGVLNRLFPFSKSSPLLVSFLLYEQMAKREGLPLENILLAFAFPKECQNFLDQVALAQLLREVFSQSWLWLSLPENPNPLSLFAAAFAEVEGVVVTPPQAVSKMPNLAQEFSINTHGQIAREAHFVLDQTWKLLKKIQHATLWKTLEQDELTNTPGAREGLGKEGVFQKSYHYWNPLLEVLECVGP